MLTRLGRRVFELVIALFAVLGFVYVPLGKKTGFEHAKAVFSTGAAKEAGKELVEAGRRVKTKLFDLHKSAPAQARLARSGLSKVARDRADAFLGPRAETWRD